MICFLDQSGQLGGAELCLADLAADYRTNGRVLLLSDGPFRDYLTDRDIPVEVLPLPPVAASLTKSAGLRGFLTAGPALASYFGSLRRSLAGADLLYFNTAKALLAGIAANVGRSTPTIFHLHDLLDETHFSRTNIRLLVAAANRTKAVIANSQATADAFLAAGGKVRTVAIPNGFTSPPSASTADVAALRERLNPRGRMVVAIFGRITRWKGQALLLEAARHLPEIEIWVVGEALFTGDDHRYAEELRVLAQTPELAGRVHLLGFRHDIAALMQAADIVVHCSTSPEPFGRVLVEAMLAGKPLIAANAGGPREIVVEGETGYLTPPGDATALAEGIRKLASPAVRTALGERGRARAVQHYGLPAVLQQTRAVIDTVLAR